MAGRSGLSSHELPEDLILDPHNKEEEHDASATEMLPRWTTL